MCSPKGDANQRLIHFFRDEVAKAGLPVVILLDEIDVALKLPYADDFFVAIQTMYDERLTETRFERISFCLSGLAAPHELIRNRQVTPYVIGRMIELRDFDGERDDLSALYKAVGRAAGDPRAGERLVRAILRWTDGHPFLTMKLCSIINEIGATEPEYIALDESFLSLDGRHLGDHFRGILWFLRALVEDKPALVRLYSEIFSCRNPSVTATAALLLLMLSGIVKRGRLGSIIVRNQIYHQVLSPGLIAEYLGLNRELYQRDENLRTVGPNTETLLSGTRKNKPNSPGSTELFYSYAHEDEPLLGELLKHLGMLKRLGVIRDWHDRQITAGSEWKGQIDRHLDASGVILLLVSPDFIASDYCWDVELTRALERHDRGEARVIPVLLRPVDSWQDAPFGELGVAPTDGRPVTSWPNQDEAFADVARHIRRAVEELRHP